MSWYITFFLADGGDLALGVLDKSAELLGDRFSTYSAIDSSSVSSVTFVEYFSALARRNCDSRFLPLPKYKTEALNLISTKIYCCSLFEHFPPNLIQI